MVLTFTSALKRKRSFCGFNAPFPHPQISPFLFFAFISNLNCVCIYAFISTTFTVIDT